MAYDKDVAFALDTLVDECLCTYKRLVLAKVALLLVTQADLRGATLTAYQEERAEAEKAWANAHNLLSEWGSPKHPRTAEAEVR